MNETLQVIRHRRSNRKFQDTPVPDDVIEAILEAGKCAPCAMNRQERHFTVIQSRQVLIEMNRDAKAIAATVQNRHLSLMAQSENYSIFHNAPVAIVVSGRADQSMAESDCAAAIQNMLLAAESLGYGGCWVNFVLFLFQGPKDEAYRTRLGILDGYRPYGSLVIGIRENEPAGERTLRGNTVNYIR